VQISAVIIAFNEQQNIAAAIRSVDFADEIVVIDSESTDRTREIAAEMGARIVINPWPGFAGQKQFAVDQAAHDWIFSLDADERVSDELRDEILRIKASDEVADGYKISRLTFYMGRAIKHGDWYPDRQLRFFDRKKGRWNDALIHESVDMQPGARIGIIDADILHYSVEGPAHHHQMIGERYAPLAARQLFEAGKTTSPAAIVVRSWFSFIRTYFLKAGFLDGFPGFCIAYFAAHHTFMKYLLLYEMSKQQA
jgi:glycosyltransferase involved in cell wall biosynthesis